MQKKLNSFREYRALAFETELTPSSIFNATKLLQDINKFAKTSREEETEGLTRLGYVFFADERRNLPRRLVSSLVAALFKANTEAHQNSSSLAEFLGPENLEKLLKELLKMRPEYNEAYLKLIFAVGYYEFFYIKEKSSFSDFLFPVKDVLPQEELTGLLRGLYQNKDLASWQGEIRLSARPWFLGA